MARRTSSFPKQPKATVKPRGFRRKTFGAKSVEDYWAQFGRGNSKLERAIDGVERDLNIFFDAYQYYVPLTVLESTIIDFVIFAPKKLAIFADGWQHQNRPDAEHQDVIRRAELEADGWTVVTITEEEFQLDPQSAVLKIYYA